MVTEQQPTSPAAQLLPLRSFYFLNLGASGALYPYLPLLLAARGLDATRIAWVMTLMPLANLFVPPLWGGLADKYNIRTALLQAASVGCGLSILLLLPGWGLAGCFLAMLFFSFFRAPVNTLADAATYAAMGGRQAPFSTVRVWGSVGFGSFALATGLVNGPSRPASLITLAAVVYCCSALSLLALPKASPGREQDVVRQTAKVLLRTPMLLFLAGSAIYYVGHAAYDVYFSLHLRALGFSDRVVGAAWAIGVGGEVLVMLMAPRVMGRLRSGTLLAGCSVIAASRWWALSQLRALAPVLLLQGLHGVTFGLWYLSLVRYTQNRAPDHLRTSLHSMTLSAMGLGMVAGYLSGGTVFHRWGGAEMFRAAALTALLALVFYGGSTLLGDRQRPA